MKKAVFLFLICGLVCSCVAWAATWEVGVIGPAGGIIFYDKGNYSDGWRYMEAAPAETDFRGEQSDSGYKGVPYGLYHEVVLGTETGVGTGKRNTELILEGLTQSGESDCAAQLCVSLNYNGFNDWFLPSKDELDLMYRNLKEKGLRDFTGIYWSSSRNINNDWYASNRYAWAQNFHTGDETWYLTQYLPHVARAIRAF